MSDEILIDEVFSRHTGPMLDKLAMLEQSIASCSAYKYHGRIVSVNGSIIIATIPQVKIGDLCRIEDKSINLQLFAEVIAINDNEVKLLPFGSIENLSHRQ